MGEVLLRALQPLWFSEALLPWLAFSEAGRDSTRGTEEASDSNRAKVEGRKEGAAAPQTQSSLIESQRERARPLPSERKEEDTGIGLQNLTKKNPLVLAWR